LNGQEERKLKKIFGGRGGKRGNGVGTSIPIEMANHGLVRRKGGRGLSNYDVQPCSLRHQDKDGRRTGKQSDGREKRGEGGKGVGMATFFLGGVGS